MERIRQQIKSLPKLERSQLLDLWRVNFGRKAPEGIRREVMIPVLSYRIQERAYGGLGKDVLAKLRSQQRDRSNTAARSASSATIKIGTRFVREWHGESHEVTVTDEGFEYRKARYKTLSEIARKITGTRWSGPLFFGLRKSLGKESLK